MEARRLLTAKPAWKYLKKISMKIYIFQRAFGWYFHIKGKNGRIVAQSEAYKTKQSVVKTAKLFNLEIVLL
jgi:uncharacterized protein YegP (UPF0339 family)